MAKYIYIYIYIAIYIYIYIYGSRPLTAWKYKSDYMSCLAFVKKGFLRIETIYLSSYMSCGIQYIGEIAVYVNLTIDIHRRGESACQILIDQFKMIVQVVNLLFH